MSKIVKRTSGVWPEPWTGWYVGREGRSFGHNGSYWILSVMPNARYRTFKVGRFILSLGQAF